MEKDGLLRDEREPGSDDQQTGLLLQYSRNSRPRLSTIVILEAALLIFSIAGNIFQYWHCRHVVACSGGSKIGNSEIPFQISRILLIEILIAGVTGGVMRPFVINTEWSSENTTQTDNLWKALAPNVGMVAIDNDFSRNLDLYATIPFPWDHDKGIYMLEGYHSLHCLVGS